MLIFFDWVWRSSLMAAVIVVVVALMKYLFKNKLGVKWHYYIWFLVLIKLVIPYAPQSSFSVHNITENIHPAVTKLIYETAPDAAGKDPAPGIEFPQGDEPVLPGETGTEDPAVDGKPPQGEQSAGDHAIPGKALPDVQPYPVTENNFSLYLLMLYLWAAGALILGAYILAVNLKFMIGRNSYLPADGRIMQLAEQCRQQMGITRTVPVVETDKVKGPALYGIFRPRLLLPKDVIPTCSIKELRYVIMHELAHVKQWDVALNWLTGLLQVIHWFNPFIWYAFRRMRQDREPACDALALSYLEEDEYKTYGLTLLSLMERLSPPVSVPLGVGILEGKDQLKNRVSLISKFNSKSYKWSASAVILLLLVGLLVLTNASSNDINVEQLSYKEGIEAARSVSLKWTPDITGQDSAVVTTEISGARPLEVLKGYLLQAEPEKPLVLPDPDRFTLTLTFDKGREISCEFLRFPGEGSAFIEYKDEWYKVPIAAIAPFHAVNVYPEDKISYQIDEGDEEFLSRWDIKPLFLINSFSVQLPEEFIHRPGESPEVIYWALSNEFNKDVGMDLTPFLGQEVEVRIYSGVGMQPDYIPPPGSSLRAIVIRKGPEVVGAWLDSADYGVSFSLNGTAITEIAGDDPTKILAELIDPRGTKEQALALLEPAEIIRDYFEAIDSQDYHRALALESRLFLSRHLSRKDNYSLYNSPFVYGGPEEMRNVLSARVISIERQPQLEADYPGNDRIYKVTADMKVEESGDYYNGINTCIFFLRQELAETGWRINGISKGVDGQLFLAAQQAAEMFLRTQYDIPVIVEDYFEAVEEKHAQVSPLTTDDCLQEIIYNRLFGMGYEIAAANNRTMSLISVEFTENRPEVKGQIVYLDYIARVELTDPDTGEKDVLEAESNHPMRLVKQKVTWMVDWADLMYFNSPSFYSGSLKLKLIDDNPDVQSYFVPVENVSQIIRIRITDAVLDDQSDMKKIIATLEQATFTDEEISISGREGFTYLDLVGSNKKQEIKIITSLDYFNFPSENGYLICNNESYLLPNSEILKILNLFEDGKHPGDLFNLSWSDGTAVRCTTSSIEVLAQDTVEQMAAILKQAVFTNLWPESHTGALDAIIEYEDGDIVNSLSFHYISEEECYLIQGNSIYLLDEQLMKDALTLLD